MVRGISVKRTVVAHQGFALLELTLAVSIFVVVIGIASQALVSFYTCMDLQKQRTVAVNECRSILSEMRALRTTNPNTTEDPINFQSAVLDQYPDGEETDGPDNLRNARRFVTYEEASADANPLVPTVTIQWTSLTGHTVQVAISSALVDS